MLVLFGQRVANKTKTTTGTIVMTILITVLMTIMTILPTVVLLRLERPAPIGRYIVTRRTSLAN
jgi:hypothetical protein